MAPSPSGSPTPSPPGAPTNFSVVAHATSLALSWTASPRGCCTIDHYEVVYWPAFDDAGYVQSDIPGTATSATITRGIVPKTQYKINMYAVDVQGHRSTSSDFVTVVTPVSDTAADHTPPSAPGSLTIVSVTSSGVVLNWQPSTDNVGVVGYDVYWFDNWFVSRLLGSTTTSTSFSAGVGGKLPNGQGPDTWYVRARDAAGNVSIASNTVAATVSHPPSYPPSSPTSPVDPPSPTSPSPSRSSSPPSPPCSIDYHPTSTWNNGFVADVVITNKSAYAWSTWTAQFHFGGDQQITNSWGGTFQQSGGDVKLTALNWNASVAPGASVTVGLLGSYRAGAGAPSAFVVNGQLCNNI